MNQKWFSKSFIQLIRAILNVIKPLVQWHVARPGFEYELRWHSTEWEIHCTPIWCPFSCPNIRQAIHIFCTGLWLSNVSCSYQFLRWSMQDGRNSIREHFIHLAASKSNQAAWDHSGTLSVLGPPSSFATSAEASSVAICNRIFCRGTWKWIKGLLNTFLFSLAVRLPQLFNPNSQNKESLKCSIL